MIGLPSLERLQDLAEEEFEIEGRRFRVEKMDAMTGVEITERLRAQLGAMEMKPTVDFVSLVMQAAFQLPVRFNKELRDKLFEYVRFHRDGVWQVLAGAEDPAFEGMEPHHVYEVQLRAFARSFTGSISAVARLFWKPAPGPGRPTTSSPGR